MFWSKKLTCEQCGKKAKESEAIYARGSYFCSAACRDAWSAANPPPIARGEKPKLELELAILIDGAIDEYSKAFAVPRSRFTVKVGITIHSDGSTAPKAGLLENINAQHEAEQRQTALMTFQTHLLRCPPLLRALGHEGEAMQIEAIDFLKVIESGQSGGKILPVTQALGKLRDQLP